MNRPSRILLATDLGPRCDRATARAVQLALQWNADLIILHCLPEGGMTDGPAGEDVPSWWRPPDDRVIAERQILADLGTLGGRAQRLIETGVPADIVARVARDQGCDLIITGPGQGETFWRPALGETGDALLTGSALPLLIVRGRVRTGYRQPVVACDFSSASRLALECAGRWFGSDPVLFHAFLAPLEQAATDRAAYRQDARRLAESDCDAFLAAGDVVPVDRVLDHGRVETLLRRYVLDRDCDLVVLGRHSYGMLGEFLLGSTARRILGAVNCDCLVVGDGSDAM